MSSTSLEINQSAKTDILENFENSPVCHVSRVTVFFCVTLRYYNFCVSLDIEVKLISYLKHNDWKICAKGEIYGILGLGIIFKKVAGRVLK